MNQQLRTIRKETEIEEHEDGSATLPVECDPETFAAIFNAGFIALVKASLESERTKGVRSSDRNSDRSICLRKN